MVVLDDKPVDHQSQMVSTSGHRECLHRCSWQYIQWLLRCLSLDQTGEIDQMTDRCTNIVVTGAILLSLEEIKFI